MNKHILPSALFCAVALAFAAPLSAQEPVPPVDPTLPERLKVGPLTAVCRSELGALNKFMHIWPYRSLNDRMETRAKAQAAGAWPPSAVASKKGLPAARLVHQENKIVMPSAFSPRQ